jgi:septal ring factor EnvC (AmiA/AmiB activator)
MIAFSQLLEAGVAGLIEAVSALEAELKATKEDIAGLNERINRLENREPSHDEADLEALIDDRIESALDMRLDEEIEARLSGREITVTL